MNTTPWVLKRTPAFAGDPCLFLVEAHDDPRRGQTTTDTPTNAQQFPNELEAWRFADTHNLAPLFTAVSLASLGITTTVAPPAVDPSHLEALLRRGADVCGKIRAAGVLRSGDHKYVLDVEMDFIIAANRLASRTLVLA
jgi:hypothetical protein